MSVASGGMIAILACEEYLEQVLTVDLWQQAPALHLGDSWSWVAQAGGVVAATKIALIGGKNGEGLLHGLAYRRVGRQRPS